MSRINSTDLEIRRTSWYARGVWVAATTAAALVLAGCGDDNTQNPPPPPPPQLTQAQCVSCHSDANLKWTAGRHAHTQADVAGELAAERSGETPDEVLHGSDPENCIACHGPTAVTANDGMSEARALDYFFTTADGKFSETTAPAHSAEWPEIGCLACHDAPTDHPESAPVLSLFESSLALYVPAGSAAELCGQCHGSLRFPGTDHLTYDAWSTSKHSLTQADVAEELAAERAGETPAEIVNGDDPENCVACHGPTAVLARGGMGEAQALDYFFTTSGGTFGPGTTAANTDEWPDVSCTACHDEHDPGGLAYFNSELRAYEALSEAAELCGQCHGSLRFPDTDHLSYDILAGTGGIGVPAQHTMPGATCTDCHMYASETEDTNSSVFHGHSWAVIVQEGAGSTAACEQCHPGMGAEAVIGNFQASFEVLHSTAQGNVAAAEQALAGVSDPALQTKLEEARHNLALAEGDESGGFHNHNFEMALLTDANTRALEILAAL